MIIYGLHICNDKYENNWQLKGLYFKKIDAYKTGIKQLYEATQKALDNRILFGKKFNRGEQYLTGIDFWLVKEYKVK